MFVKVELFSATHSFYSSCYSLGAGCAPVTPASVCPEKDNLQKGLDFFGVEMVFFSPTSDYRAKFQCRGTCVQAGRRVSMDIVGAAVSCTSVILLSCLSLRTPPARSIVLINKVTLANNHSTV